MASYVSALDPIARERYNQKLGLLGLSEIEEPYKLWKADKFVDDLTLWPPVEYGISFVTLLKDPGSSQSAN